MLGCAAAVLMSSLRGGLDAAAAGAAAGRAAVAVGGVDRAGFPVLLVGARRRPRRRRVAGDEPHARAALVLNLGGGHWVGFDTDLLRVAAMWRGNGVTPRALAPGSYHDARSQDAGRAVALPEPDGNGLDRQRHLSGMAERRDAVARRSARAGADVEEVGRGPCRSSGPLQGRPSRRRRRGARIHRCAAPTCASGLTRHETAAGRRSCATSKSGPPLSPLWLVLGVESAADGIDRALRAAASRRAPRSRSIADGEPTTVVRRCACRRTPQPVRFCVAVADGAAPTAASPPRFRPLRRRAAGRRK